MRAVAALALATVVGSLAAATPAATTPRPLLLTFAFSFNRGEIGPNGGLCAIDVGSGRSFRLTSRSDDRTPAWSHDGRQLAFVRQFGNRQKLFDVVVKRISTNRRVLATSRIKTEFQFEPSWAPGGRRLVVAAGYRGAVLYVVDMRNGRARKLPSPYFVNRSPAWSPDGRTIAFTASLGPELSVYTIRPDGTGLRRLIADAAEPAWSPDGTRIAFVRDGTVFVARADGSGERRLTEPSTSDTRPAWSPDGRTIAFARLDSGLYTIAPDGSNLRLVLAHRYAVEPAWRPRAPLPRGLTRC